MDSPEFDRRDFSKWMAAAVSGIIAGSTSGCSDPDAKPAPTQTGAPATAGAKDSPTAASTTAKAASAEFHLCRGLNECKGKGASGKNECAGQGTCASIASHSCGGHNECKGQGGCGATPGQNDCKGMGACAVPLMEGAWTKARAAFEAKMKAADKTVGAAPAKS